MIPPGDPTEKNRSPYSFGMKWAAVGGEIGCLTLVIVLAAVFGGLLLDRQLGTRPMFTIMIVLGSAPISLALTFWVAMRAVRDIQPPPRSSGRKPTRVEEEGDDNW